MNPYGSGYRGGYPSGYPVPPSSGGYPAAPSGTYPPAPPASPYPAAPTPPVPTAPVTYKSFPTPFVSSPADMPPSLASDGTDADSLTESPDTALPDSSLSLPASDVPAQPLPAAGKQGDSGEKKTQDAAAQKSQNGQVAPAVSKQPGAQQTVPSETAAQHAQQQSSAVPPRVLSTQQTSLGDGTGKRFQQTGAAEQPKKKLPLFLIIGALAVVFVIVLVFILTPNTYYKVEIINSAKPGSLENYAVTHENGTVESEQSLREKTKITVEWSASSGFVAELWINGKKTDVTSPYTHTLEADVVIEFRTRESEPEPEPDITHWSDARIGTKSQFYQTYYKDHILSGPFNGILKISEPADLGAVAYVSLQKTDVKPVKQTFIGWTLQLQNDLDMSKYRWMPIMDFCGNFDGNGFTISGLDIDALEDARPRFDSFSPNGELLLSQNKNAAFIAGVQANVTISDLTLKGLEGKKIYTSSQTPLIIPAVKGMRAYSGTQYASNAPDGMRGQLVGTDMFVSDEVDYAVGINQIVAGTYVENTWENVTVRRAFRAAGFVSEILSDGATLNFINCKNYIEIESENNSEPDTSDAFGFLASSRANRMAKTLLPSNSALASVTASATSSAGVYLNGCINYGNIKVQSPYYGAAGLAAAATKIMNSANYGSIEAVSGNVAGLVVGMSSRSFHVRYSYNRGAITISGNAAGSYAGGITVGQVVPNELNADVHIYVRDCANYGSIINYSASDSASGGILALVNNNVTTGRLFIQNCLSIGALDIATSVSGDNYFGGIAAKIMGKGRSRIDVVFIANVNPRGTDANRGASVVDHIDYTLDGSNNETFENTQITGALYRGGTAPLTRATRGSSMSYYNYRNYGKIIDNTGSIAWDERTEFVYDLPSSSAEIPNLFATGSDGIFEYLKQHPGSSYAGEYAAWVADSKRWITHPDMGTWGMVLELSEFQIAKFDFSGGWLEPETEVHAGSEFVHTITAPADTEGWKFVGYSTTQTGVIIARKDSALSSIDVFVFGEAILYERWEQVAA